MEVLEPENLQNLFSLYESLGVAGIGPVLLCSPYYTVIQTPGSDWPNMAFGIDQTKFGDQVAGNIARDMTALGLRPTMILPNGTHWAGILRSCGFLPVDQWTGMSYDRIGGGLFDAVNGERAAFILDDERDIDSWTAIVSEALFGGRPLDSGIFRWLHNRGAEMIGMRIGDEMAGSTMIYFDDTGTAGIYMVGVKGKFRKQGLGKELILFCLDRLKKRGIDKCYLQSTRMGAPLYKSLDFQERDKYLIFCKVK